jgi:hypothetical protein
MKLFSFPNKAQQHLFISTKVVDATSRIYLLTIIGLIILDIIKELKPI